MLQISSRIFWGIVFLFNLSRVLLKVRPAWSLNTLPISHRTNNFKLSQNIEQQIMTDNNNNAQYTPPTRRNCRVESSRVGDGGVYWALGTQIITLYLYTTDTVVRQID